MLEVTPRVIWMQGTVWQWGLSDRCHPTEPLYWRALKSVSISTTSLHKGGFQRAPEPSSPNSSCFHSSEALCALCNRVVGRYLLTEASSRARSHRDIVRQPRSSVALTQLHGFQRSWYLPLPSAACVSLTCGGDKVSFAWSSLGFCQSRTALLSFRVPWGRSALAEGQLGTTGTGTCEKVSAEECDSGS